MKVDLQVFEKSRFFLLKDYCKITSSQEHVHIAMVTTVYEKLYTKSLILSLDGQQNALNLNATLNFLLCVSVKVV